MLSEEEKVIVKRLKSEGYTTAQIGSHLGALRVGGQSSIDAEKLKNFREKEERNTPLVNKFTNAIGLEKSVDTFGSLLARQGVGPQTKEEGQQFVQEPTGKEVAGAVLKTASASALPATALIPGGLAVQTGVGLATGYLYDVASDLEQNKSMGEVLTPGMGTLVGGAVPPAFKGLGILATGGKNVVSGVAQRVGGAMGEAVESTVPQGVKQTVTELAERVPRAIEKGGEFLDEAAQRAERIKTATPPVQNAIKSGLDDVVITAVEQADEPTRAAYKKMVEIAESPRTGLRPAVRPESVAGDAVADQYKILDTQRRSVGSQLGDAVDKLSTKGAVDVLPAQRGMRDLLRVNNILPDQSGKLRFDGSSLTPKQQALVQQLYEIATQSETMTPRQVYNMDKLFSQLQREARFDGLDNLYLSTPNGDINAFRAFRNIFSNQLDQIAPEIAPLNKQYAQLRNLQDDIEGSIVKRGNYESTRNVDPGEFAQTNLRRAFSDAQSAADYRELADKLDAFARGNGYTGANPLDLAGFAQRLREVYPETVPETSAQGIFGGVKGAIERVMKLGAPDVTDQQKALKELLGISQSNNGANALAALPGAAAEDDETQAASVGIAAVGLMESVKKGALDEYIKGLEDQLEKVVEKNPNNYEKTAGYKQIMKALLQAAKELRKLK